MTTSGSYVFKDEQRDTKKEIERLAAQARLGWKKEARTLTWFGLKEGMSLLELGSGPGFITEQLHNLVPASPITCLEIDPVLIEKARQFLPPASSQHIEFVQGSVMEMKLPDNHFDFAYGRLLFQHLPDPLSAAKEALRVLKPGGKLVIFDIDDDMYGLNDPAVPEFNSFIKKIGQLQASRGGNRNVGRRLWRLLKASGFVNLDLEIIASHSDDEGIESFLPQIDPERAAPLLKMGLISEAEMAGLRAAQARFLAATEPYVLMAMLMVCGEKPA